MFSYCNNNPIRYRDSCGSAPEEADLDDQTKDELFNQPLGDPTSGNSDGEAMSGTEYGAYNPNYLSFNSNELFVEHYGKHNPSFGNAFETSQDYVDAANYVIQNGDYVPGQNAYVKFYGLNGHANYAFVGVSSDRSFITTFHVKPASQIQFG